ncbi:hypothetical protein MKX03_001556 [Papaver bracteatum]|nr:hypothetical protein MKX03_001556 [Papaver bracteatum]
MYKKLYNYVLEGDFGNALTDFFERDSESITVGITTSSETALHVAVGAGKSEFVKSLLDRLQPKELELQESNNGDTALHTAAINGDMTSAVAMVTKNPDLTQVRNKRGWIPLVAAVFCSSSRHKEMMEYLLCVTRHDYRSPFVGRTGGELICTLTRAGHFETVISLIKQHPNLATVKNHKGTCVLEILAQMPHAFPSGSRLTWWQRYIYANTTLGLSTEQLGHRPQHPILNFVSFVIRAYISRVPAIKKVYDQKLMHKEVQALLKLISEQLSKMSSYEASEFFKNSSILMISTTNGILEIVEECISAYPDIVRLKMKEVTLLEIAIEKRKAKLFYRIHETNLHKPELIYFRDNSYNNILHLAAKYSPSAHLYSDSCVAFQMQKELQWFKGVESIALPMLKLLRNNDGKTPQELFIQEHEELMDKAEKWMKETTSSCMLVATLIATVMFAAAFTVPGGNYSDNDANNKGIPIFLHKNWFTVFIVSDALALFSSIASVLMFLAILTSPYGGGYFLKSLPKRMLIGLATLFFSIASMMVAFSATLIIAVIPRFGWVPILPLAVLASVPVLLFAFLQLPLFVNMLLSTYGRSIFSKYSRPL